MLTTIKGLFTLKKGVSDKVFYSYLPKSIKNKVSNDIGIKSKHYVSQIEGIYVKENMEEKDIYIPYTSNSNFESNGMTEVAFPIGKDQYMSKEIFITSEINNSSVTMVLNKGNINLEGSNQGIELINSNMRINNEISIVDVDDNKISKKKINKLDGKKVFYSEDKQKDKLNVKYFDDHFRD